MSDNLCGTHECCPNHVSVPAIGCLAPDFEAEAVFPDSSFKKLKLSDYRGQWIVLFFYPLDWTFVCPTEIIAFSEANQLFNQVNAQLIAISVDSAYSHLSWTQTPRNAGGLDKIQIPIVSDITKSISNNYGAMFKNSGHTLRALFLIDPQGILRHFTFNEPPVGRSTDEVYRLITAFQFADKHGEVCPANWKIGSSTIIPDPEKKAKYFSMLG